MKALITFIFCIGSLVVFSQTQRLNVAGFIQTDSLVIKNNITVNGLEIGIGGNSGVPILNQSFKNIALGFEALKTANGNLVNNNNFNVAIGNQAMKNIGETNTRNSIGSHNIALGYRSLSNTTNGLYNIGIGSNAGSYITTGSNNVTIGANTGASIYTGNYNFVIGNGQDVPIASGSNQLNLAGVIFGIGVGVNGLNPKIGILKNNPRYALDVAGDLAFSGKLMVGESAGLAGQALISAGSGAAPTWSNVNKPIIPIWHQGVNMEFSSGVKNDTLKLPLANHNVPAGLISNGYQIIRGIKSFGGIELAFGTQIGFLRWTDTYEHDWTIGVGTLTPAVPDPSLPTPELNRYIRFVYRGLSGNEMGRITFENTGSIVASGSITASSTLYSSGSVLTSDRRLKTNLKPLGPALPLINQLRAVEYDKKENMANLPYRLHEYGFVAQEVQKVLPLLVTAGNDPDQLLHLNYVALIPLLTKAVQEQQQEISEIKEMNRLLLQELNEMKKWMSKETDVRKPLIK